MHSVRCDACGCTPCAAMHDGDLLIMCECDDVLIVGRDHHLPHDWS